MKVILINPGHGGKDPGARDKGWMWPIIEKKANLNVSLKLAELLELDGYFAVLSRMYDTDNDVAEVQEQIRRIKPDLVISVHHNAGGGFGAEVYAQVADERGGPSRTLAGYVLEEFKALGQTSRGIKYKRNSAGNADYFGVLRTSAALGIPAILTEYAFLDSDDVADIDTFTEQWGEAAAIHKAVKKFMPAD